MKEQEAQPTQTAISRPVEILVGIRAIAAFLKLRISTVRELEKRGAPIARDSTGVMRAEKGELWKWMKEN